MAATTGTPPAETTGTSNGKPGATKVIDSSRDKPDAASAATTESNQPSAEKILDTGPQATGTPTPSKVTVTQTDTGKSSAATYGDPTGFGGVTEPNTASPTATQQYARPNSGTTSTSTTDTSSRTDTGPKADSGTTDNLTETARDIGQQVGSRAAEEWQQRKQQVSEVAGNLKDSAARSAEQVWDAANRTTYRVRQQSGQGINAAQTMITDHPMAIALVALGVGLLLGSMLGGQGRKSRAYDDRDQDLDLGEYGASRSYRSRDRESDYRRAETNAGYDRSGY
jgi:ElaB/YqjD/DUF883 family membrane-anchored ribosome-binding protein